LDDRFVEQLAAACIQPAHINLSNNQITDAGVAALCSALRPGGGSTSVRSISLAYNCITDEGAAALANLLQEGCNLENLCLEGNHIGPKGARRVAQAAACSQLSAALMSYNALDSSQLEAWAQALAHARLQVLEVAQLTSHSKQVRALVYKGQNCCSCKRCGNAMFAS
jgi:NLR family CARD domain-containing protein 3